MPDTSNENIMINRLKILSMEMKLKVDAFLWKKNVKWDLEQGRSTKNLEDAFCLLRSFAYFRIVPNRIYEGKKCFHTSQKPQRPLIKAKYQGDHDVTYQKLSSRASPPRPSHPSKPDRKKCLKSLCISGGKSNKHSAFYMTLGTTATGFLCFKLYALEENKKLW